jgi:hypothetical protein
MKGDKKMDIALIEITEEELAALIKKREEEARRGKALELLGEIKELVASINALGYHIRLPEIGGCYMRRYDPEVTKNNITLRSW